MMPPFLWQHSMPEPEQENPILVFPVLGKPVQENPAQLNTNILKNIYQVQRYQILFYLLPSRDKDRIGKNRMDNSRSRGPAEKVV